jgi:hypothetical protein
MIAILILVTAILPTSAFAQSSLWRGGSVFQYESVSTPFSTGNDNKLTVSAQATVLYGNPGYVTVKLQKNVLGIYVTEKTMNIPTNGSNVTFANGYPVDKNTTYRFAYSCGGSSGIDAANISLGIVIWQ